MYFLQANYSEAACLKTCYQREVVRQCGCYKPSIPFDPRSDAFKDLNLGEDIDICDDSEDEVCK